MAKNQIRTVPAADGDQNPALPQRVQELAGTAREPDLLPPRILHRLPINARERRLERQDIFMLPQRTVAIEDDQPDRHNDLQDLF